MTVWPHDIGTWEWVDRAPDLRARLAYEAAFKEMHTLDTEQPAGLRLVPEAQELFRTWMTEIQAEARSGTLSSALEKPRPEDAENGREPSPGLRVARQQPNCHRRNSCPPRLGVG
jgi:hypothetical protein